MSQQRARAVAKRKAKLKERDQDRATRRSRLERILGLMGLKDWCRHLGEDTLDQLCRWFNPGPRVVPDPGRPRDLDLADRAKVIQGDLDRVAIRVGLEELSFNDYHCVVRMLLGLFSMGATDRTLGGFMRGPAAAVDEFTRRHHDLLWDAYRSRLLRSLSEAGGLDTSVYSARWEFVPIGDRSGLTMTVLRTESQSRTIEADGIGRRAYRCGVFGDLETGEVEWTEWDARELGLGPSGRLPVYIQTHALIQARQRLGIKPEHFLKTSLCWSLHDPVLTPLPGGACLVEYSIFDHKLGYFVAERVGDVVLVRTFLLVTMQGTPEGSELAYRLRLRRPDIEYLELDRLGTFIATDLARNPEIIALLRDCGCGGVFDMAEKVYQGSIIEGYAARFRSHLGPAFNGFAVRHSEPASG